MANQNVTKAYKDFNKTQFLALNDHLANIERDLQIGPFSSYSQWCYNDLSIPE